MHIEKNTYTSVVSLVYNHAKIVFTYTHAGTELRTLPKLINAKTTKICFCHLGSQRNTF